jgi:hypothetical protein
MTQDNESKQSSERDATEPIEPGQKRLEKYLLGAEDLKIDPASKTQARSTDSHPIEDQRQTLFNLAAERERTMNEDNDSRLSRERDLTEPIEPGQKRLERRLLRAEDLKMDPDRLLRYAQLLGYAEDRHAGERTSADHTRRARADIIGQMFGVAGGYDRPEEAIQHEHRARETGQQFCKIVEAAVHLMRKAEASLDKHPDHFTQGLRVNYPRNRITEMRVFWTRLAAAANPHKTSYQREEPMRQFASVSLLVLTSWKHSVPDYDGKWQDMYALARLWHVSNSKDLDSFMRYVRRIAG